MGCGPSLQPKKVASLHTLSHRTPDSEILNETLLPCDSRGAKPKLSSREEPSCRTEQMLKGYALLFAVDTYTYMTPLSAAVADADAMAKCLSRLGFKVVLQLYNKACTLAALQQKLRESCTALRTDARVLIFLRATAFDTPLREGLSTALCTQIKAGCCQQDLTSKQSLR